MDHAGTSSQHSLGLSPTVLLVLVLVLVL